MGELSKKIGEIGENITGNFFDLIGWGNALPNETLRCLKPLKHARKSSKKNKRETHGIDYLFSYRSSLEGNTVNNIVISVKNTNNPYPNNPVSKFKEHLEDIAHTIECFNRSPLKSNHLRKYRSYKKTNDIGVLFWLSHDNNTYNDVITKLSNCKINKDLKFDSLYVVDNKRIEFIFKTVTFLKNNFKCHEVMFYHPQTSLNYSDPDIIQSSKTLQVEYINSPIVFFLLRQKHGVDTFCIASNDNFDESEFLSLLQAARNYTNDIRCKYLFIFPNYIRSEHHDSVIKALNYFESNIRNEVEVMNFDPDYRSLNNA